MLKKYLIKKITVCISPIFDLRNLKVFQWTFLVPDLLFEQGCSLHFFRLRASLGFLIAFSQQGINYDKYDDGRQTAPT